MGNEELLDQNKLRSQAAVRGSAWLRKVLERSMDLKKLHALAAAIDVSHWDAVSEKYLTEHQLLDSVVGFLCPRAEAGGYFGYGRPFG